MGLKKLVKSVSKAVRSVASPVSAEKVKTKVARSPNGIIADLKMAAGPKAQAEGSPSGNLMKRAAKKIGGMKFKDGGMADKTGRAMKKTDADAKGRAMTKAPKKMMGGGMMKGYAEGGDVTCGKATRGYGAARKGK